MPDPDRTAAPYLEYLKIEMTIMALLSAFCIAALAAMIDQISATEPPVTILSTLWKTAPDNIASVWAGLLISAFMFYRQRSKLAWNYGEISFLQTQNFSAAVISQKVFELAVDCHLWVYYQIAFVWIFFSCAEFAFVVVVWRSGIRLTDFHEVTVVVPTIMGIGMSWLVKYTLKKWPNYEKPVT